MNTWLAIPNLFLTSRLHLIPYTQYELEYIWRNLRICEELYAVNDAIMGRESVSLLPANFGNAIRIQQCNSL
jgi:hypothetical protein